MEDKKPDSLELEHLILDEVPDAPASGIPTKPDESGRTPIVEDKFAAIRQAILEEIDLGVIVIDPATNWVVFSNRSAVHLAEPQAGDPADFALFDHLRRLTNTAHGAGTEKNLHSIRVGHRVLGFSSYSLPGDRICYLVRDITEKARQDALTTAIASTRDVGFICSSIRHELGNPISGVKMALNVLRENSGDLSEKTINDYLDQATQEIVRIESLLRSLKAFSMYEKLRIERVGLAGFLLKLLALLRHQFEQHKVIVSPRLGEDAIHISADPRALHQVMLNLFSNAFDALEGRANPRIEIQTTRRHRLVTIAITDNGCGIAEEHHGDLFVPFFTTKKNRAGLGLAIAKRLITNMNGTITVDSQLGVGTKISITFTEGRIDRDRDRETPRLNQRS